MLSSSHMTQWHLTLPPIDYMNMMIKLKNLIHQQSKICGDFGRGGGVDFFTNSNEILSTIYWMNWTFKWDMLIFKKKIFMEIFLSDWILIIFSLSWCYNMVKSFFFFKNSIIRELVNGLKYIFLTAYIYACMVCSSV